MTATPAHQYPGNPDGRIGKPEPLPRLPKIAGPRRNGLPEMKPYVYRGSGADAITGTPGMPVSAPTAEDYACPGCGGSVKVVSGVLRPDHDPECPVGKRARTRLNRVAS